MILFLHFLQSFVPNFVILYIVILSAQVSVPRVRLCLPHHMVECHLLQKHEWDRKPRYPWFSAWQKSLPHVASCENSANCSSWFGGFFPLTLEQQLHNCIVLIWYQGKVHCRGAVNSKLTLVVQVDIPESTFLIIIKSYFKMPSFKNPHCVTGCDLVNKNNQNPLIKHFEN